MCRPGWRMVHVAALLTLFHPSCTGRPEDDPRDLTTDAVTAYRLPEERTSLPEVTGGGVCVTDVEGDGDPDLFLTQTEWSHAPGQPGLPDILLVNNGRGEFENVSGLAGILTPNHSVGCAVADVDNDGDEDIFVTGVESSLLYANDGGGHYTESSDARGLTHGGMATSAAFEDFDRDGWIDLFVARYVRADSPDPASLAACRSEDFPPEICPLLPGSYPPLPNILYRNRGDGTFEDVSGPAGLADRLDRTLSASWNDVDRDGDADLYVGNERGESGALYINQGDGTFREQSGVYGLGLNLSLPGGSSRGADFADVDNDGDMDLFVAGGPPNGSLFYVRLKDGTFLDGSEPVGFTQRTQAHVASGVVFADFNSDGWMDLALATGGTLPPPLADDPRIPEVLRAPFKDSILLFRNRQGRGFEPWAAEPPFPPETPHSSRGLASADFDGDSHPDLAVVRLGAPPAILIHRTAPPALGLRLRLVGTRSNRSAVGAVIELTSGGITQIRRVTAGSGHLSQNDLTQHFGLGNRPDLTHIVIHWPSGVIQDLPIPEPNRLITVEETRE